MGHCSKDNLKLEQFKHSWLKTLNDRDSLKSKKELALKCRKIWDVLTLLGHLEAGLKFQQGSLLTGHEDLDWRRKWARRSTRVVSGIGDVRALDQQLRVSFPSWRHQTRKKLPQNFLFVVAVVVYCCWCFCCCCLLLKATWCFKRENKQQVSIF